MSFLRCHWSVENISCLHFTPNESKVATGKNQLRVGSPDLNANYDIRTH